MFERSLQAVLLRPVQQAVRIKGVVDAAALVHAEGESQLGTARGNGFAVLLALLGRGAVLFVQVLANVLAFRCHLRVQLERLKVQVDRDFILEPVCRLLQRLEADDAPGAGHVRDEINLEGSGRGSHGKVAPAGKSCMVVTRQCLRRQRGTAATGEVFATPGCATPLPGTRPQFHTNCGVETSLPRLHLYERHLHSTALVLRQGACYPPLTIFNAARDLPP